MTNHSPEVESPSPVHKAPTALPKRVENAWSAHDSLDFTSDTSFHGGPRPTRKTFAFSFIAHVIDQLLTVSVVLICSSFFLYLNRGHNSFLIHREKGNAILIPAILLYMLLLSLLMAIPRIFLGCTPGEWACNLRLGFAEQRFSSRYTFFVLKRMIVCLMTGGVTLLVLSLIIGKDLAGLLCKVPIVDREHSK